MVWLGIVLLIIGVILFFVQRHQKQKMFSIQSARPMTAAELNATAGAVAEEIGGGSWRDYVKLWGTVIADRPLHSEHKQAPCVHYISEVIRVYEKKDEDGKTKQSSETVANNKQSMPFLLRDRTGTVKIDPEGAQIDVIKIMDDYRAERSGDTLGYRYREAVLPVDREVLVVGAVSDLTGDVVIGKPVKSDHKYLISLKNEEVLADATQRNARQAFYFMVGCLALGAVLTLIGLIR